MAKCCVSSPNADAASRTSAMAASNSGVIVGLAIDRGPARIGAAAGGTNADEDDAERATATRERTDFIMEWSRGFAIRCEEWKM